MPTETDAMPAAPADIDTDHVEEQPPAEERRLYVRTKPKGPGMNARMAVALQRIAEANSLDIAPNELGNDAAKPAPAKVTGKPGRALNGQFQSRLRAVSKPADSELDVDGGEETTAPADDPNETPTLPDSPKAKPSRLDRLADRAKKEREKRSADMTLRDAQRERQQIAQERQQLAQARATLDQQMQALRSGDPNLLDALLGQIGPERVSQFLLRESTPEARAARAANGHAPPQYAAPAQHQPAGDDRLARLEAKIDQFVGAQQQAKTEAQFQDMIRGASTFEYGKGGTPMTARLLEKNPARVMKLAKQAYLDLQSMRQPFDDADIALMVEEELQGLSALYAPKEAPPAKAPNARTPAPSPLRIAPVDAPTKPALAVQRRPEDSPSARLARRTENAMRALNQMNRR